MSHHGWGIPSDAPQRRRRAHRERARSAGTSTPPSPVEHLDDVVDAEWREVEEAQSEASPGPLGLPSATSCPAPPTGESGRAGEPDANAAVDHATASETATTAEPPPQPPMGDAHPGPAEHERNTQADAAATPYFIGTTSRARFTNCSYLTMLSDEKVRPDLDELEHAFSVAGAGVTAEPGRRAFIRVTYRRAPDRWLSDAKGAYKRLDHVGEMPGRSARPLHERLALGRTPRAGLAAVLVSGGGLWLGLPFGGVLALVAVLVALAAAFPRQAIATGRGLGAFASWLQRVVIGGQQQPRLTTKPPTRTRAERTEDEERVLAAMKSKLDDSHRPRGAFEAALRVGVFGRADDDADELRELRSEIEQALRVYETDYQQLDWHKEDPRAHLAGELPSGTDFVLSGRELGELARVPDDGCNPRGGTVRVARLRMLPMPPQQYTPVPDPLNPPPGVAPIGSTGYGTQRRFLGLELEALNRHFFMVGATGTGKSTVFEWMVYGAAKSGLPIVSFDPHGANTENNLAFLMRHCPERLDDVVVLDPGTMDGPHGGWSLALNPLAVRDRADVRRALTIIGDILDSQLDLDADNNPRARRLATAAVIAMLEANLWLSPENQMNLLHLPAFFRKPELRLLVMEFCEHPETRDLLGPGGEFDAVGEKAQVEMASVITRKLGKLAEDEPFARVYTSPTNRLSLPSLLAEGKIVLLRLARFSEQKQMGEFIAGSLLPSVLRSLEVFGVRRDPESGEALGHPSALFLDEAHVFFANQRVAQGLESALAEARKFELKVCGTTQFPEQLPDSSQKALFANTRNKIALQVEPGSVRRFAETMSLRERPLDRQDIGGLPPYNAYGDLLYNGGTERTGPFSFATLAPPFDYTALTPGEKELRADIIERTRKAYYNRGEDMDCRRADMVPAVMDELARKLNERSAQQATGGAVSAHSRIEEALEAAAHGAAPPPPTAEPELQRESHRRREASGRPPAHARKATPRRNEPARRASDIDLAIDALRSEPVPPSANIWDL